MRLEIFGTADAKRWDDIVNSSVNGTLYHTWDWLKIVEKHSASKLFPLVFFDVDDDKPFGAIPLFYMRKFGVKMVFSPPPGSAITLGPVLSKKGYKQHKFELAYLDFQANIDSFIKRLGSNYISILTSPNLLDIRPFLWAQYKVAPFYTYLIRLSPGKENIWNNLRKNTRRDINIAQNKGIIIAEQTNESSLDYVYNSSFQRYAQSHLKFSVSKNYVLDLLKQYGESTIKIFTAQYQGQIVTALACILNKESVCAWMGGVRTEKNELEANKLLYWNAIMWALDNNYKYFELMGANTRHLCAFKSMFEPQVSIMFQIKKMNFIGNLAEKAYLLMRKRYI